MFKNSDKKPESSARKGVRYTLNSISALLFLIITCVLIQDNIPSDPPVNAPSEVPLLSKGLACSKQDECKAATILVGKIDRLATESILKNIDTIKDRGLLCFLSGGGSGKAMVNITRIIRENNIPVCLADKYIVKNNEASLTGVICASACGFILMSADERVYIGKEPLVGIHTPVTMMNLCFCEIPLWFSTDKSEDHIDKLINDENNINRKQDIARYYALSLETDSSDMHFLSKDEIASLNVFTQVIGVD